MNYTGIDHHKRYSVACTLDAQGRRLLERRIDHNAPEAFAAYFAALAEPSAVVIEACWNWAALYDLLEATPGVAQVVLSNPAKNRIIADAQIKNDRVDARALATLLRGNFVAAVHVPDKPVRQKKNTVRQRLWLARVRTMVRNRIHTVLDRHPRLERPAVKDPFSQRGKAWMKRVVLPAPDRQLLTEDLELHELIERHIHALEDRIEADNAANAEARRLRTLPGVGKVLGPVIALEIDGIARFRTPDKLCAYAGLVPTTYSSGGKTSHGRMLPFCNRWLKWAFIEAAWVAVGCDGYLGTFYKRHRARGKGANEAITITARRLAKIAWKMLTEQRNYSKVPLTTKPLSPAALITD
ncbi:MAG: IS110 family transposase [Opitutaceae bacterium]|nr:IS110 family transposase [Opitutaceae bacterium]